MWWRSHRRTTTRLYHLLLPCGSTSGLQTTHTIEFVGVGEHKISRQGIEFLITHTSFIDGLHDILLVIEQIIDFESKSRIRPCLVNREIPNQFIHIGQSLVAMA